MNTIVTFSLVLVAACLFSLPALSFQLDAAQTRLLNDAAYYMKDVDKQVPQLTERAQKLQAGTLTLDSVGLQRAMNEVSYAGSKLDNAFRRLNQLPKQEAGVREMHTRATQRAQELLAAEQVFQKARDGKLAAKKAFTEEELRTDQERLSEFSRYLSQADFLWNDPAYCIDPVRNLPRAVALRDELEKKYAAILEETEGRSLKAEIDGFDYRLKQYRAAYPQAAQLLPQQARTALENARNIAAIAQERRNPGGFTNGAIAQSQERARVAIELLELLAVAPAEVAALQGEWNAAQSELAAAQDSLVEEIIAGNRAPSHLYAGDDVDALLETVRGAWNQRHPGSEVLGLRIPMARWERRTGWRWALDEFQRYDESHLQVAIVVKASGEATHAHVFYAHLRRDHQAGESTDVRIDDAGEVPPYRTLLLQHWN